MSLSNQLDLQRVIFVRERNKKFQKLAAQARPRVKLKLNLNQFVLVIKID